MSVESFVTADEVAQHLKIRRRQVLQMARENTIPAHPICFGRRRRTWRFKLTEIDQAIAAMPGAREIASRTIAIGSPRSRKEQSNG